MLIKINKKEFEINTKLGTTFIIEERFKKPYLRVLSEIQNLTAKEQIEMLACGIVNKDEKNEFKEAIKELGIGELTEKLEEFIDELQYPGLTESEKEEKKLQKIAKQKHMKEIGLIN